MKFRDVKADGPTKTIEVYHPKHDGDIPGWQNMTDDQLAQHEIRRLEGKLSVETQLLLKRLASERKAKGAS